MVIYLCTKELSKPGYKTSLISCRKTEQDGKQTRGFLEGMESLSSDLPDGHLDQCYLSYRHSLEGLDANDGLFFSFFDQMTEFTMNY